MHILSRCSLRTRTRKHTQPQLVCGSADGLRLPHRGQRAGELQRGHHGKRRAAVIQVQLRFEIAIAPVDARMAQDCGVGCDDLVGDHVYGSMG